MAPRPTSQAIADALEHVEAILAQGGMTVHDEDALDVLRRASRLPELMGAKDVARALGTATGNLGKFPRLPEPLYVLERGKLWEAAAIHELVAARRAGQSTGGEA